MDKRVFCSTDWYIWYSFVLTTKYSIYIASFIYTLGGAKKNKTETTVNLY
jgi:hypothetical protein